MAFAALERTSLSSLDGKSARAGTMPTFVYCCIVSIYIIFTQHRWSVHISSMSELIIKGFRDVGSHRALTSKIAVAKALDHR